MDAEELTGGQLMTLAAVAATAATPRPSGEGREAQGLRMLRGMWTHLADPSLDTGGIWRVMWLGLGPDNANMAYIAQDMSGTNRFAVVVRGTVGSTTDMLEDIDVGTVVPFPEGGSAATAVSAGAMAAFTQVVNAAGIVGTPAELAAEEETGEPQIVLPGGRLTAALGTLLAAAPSSPRPTVYVTGHSLGGCVATMLAAYLQARSWPGADPQFGLVTFAAPTAGVKSFADHVDSLPWSLYAMYANAWDVVPQAWWNLLAVKEWFKDPGPKADRQVKFLMTQLSKLPKGNVYTQPDAGRTPLLNPDYRTHDSVHIHRTTADFEAQIGYQHANDTYLALLGVPPVPTGPVVTSVAPSTGQGVAVVITGSGFTAESVVDFGTIPCQEASVDPSGTSITATSPADGLGVVDIRVTNDLGTSPAVPLARFAFAGPPPVVVSGVSPEKAAGGTTVTVHGSGFVREGTTVRVGDLPGENVAVTGPTELTVVVPVRDADGEKPEPPETVDVTATVGVATSATGAADEFTYTR